MTVLGDDESRYFEDTVPFDDDGDLEAEPVNLTGETQVLDFAGETQPLDYSDGDDGDDDDDDAETQLLDDEGVVGVESDGDGECSDGTQVLEDVDDDEHDVSDSNPQCAEKKEEEVPGEPSDKKSLAKNADAVVNERNSSGESFHNCFFIC